MPSVAFIHPFLFRYPRGIERYTVNLSSALVRQGVEASILTWAWPRPISWAELDSRVRVQVFPTSPYHAARMIVPFYAAHLARHRYDMVYIHFADYGEATALNILRCFGRSQPYTIVLHFPYSQVPHRYETLVSSGLYRRAAEIIAVSDFVAQEAHAFTGRSSQVISHGVDVATFSPEPSARVRVSDELDMDGEAPLLLTVAALEERKGVQWMLRALPQILEKYPSAIYLIVGDGPFRERLQALARELGVAENARFLLGQPEVARFYQAADVMLILARGEASSIVSLEAMACATPIITSCHAPFGELVRPEWGLQVNEQDTAAVADSILGLLAHPENRQEMGRAARAHILRHHTWELVAQHYLRLL